MTAAREARLTRDPGTRPTAAVAGDVDPGVLRATGWQVRGRLLTTPYDDPRDVPSYAGVADLVEDADLDLVVLDAADPLLARALPELREAGLLVLLPTPAPLDEDLLRAARAVEGAQDVAVALLSRWEPWACTVAAALPLAGGPPLQVTVRGWPRGPAAAAELTDLVAGWCGDIAAVVAAPGPLPADALPGGARVAWSLLTASGATVLVSHDDGPPLVRLSFASARLEAGPLGARWEGGAELPLLAPPDPLPADRTAPPPPGTPAGLLACATALRSAVGLGDVPAVGWPWPADLGNLLTAARVLAALRESARAEQLVRVA